MFSTIERFKEFNNKMFNTVVATSLIVCILSILFQPEVPRSELEIVKCFDKFDFKLIQFKPNIDLSPCFNFNTKQVFIYLNIKDDVGNSQMIWHKIVERGHSLKLFDIEKSYGAFRTLNDMEYELRAHIFPIVGKMKDIHIKTIK